MVRGGGGVPRIEGVLGNVDETVRGDGVYGKVSEIVVSRPQGLMRSSSIVNCLDNSCETNSSVNVAENCFEKKPGQTGGKSVNVLSYLEKPDFAPKSRGPTCPREQEKSVDDSGA